MELLWTLTRSSLEHTHIIIINARRRQFSIVSYRITTIIYTFTYVIIFFRVALLNFVCVHWMEHKQHIINVKQDGDGYHTHKHTYMYAHTEREREKEGGGDAQTLLNIHVLCSCFLYLYNNIWTHIHIHVDARHLESSWISLSLSLSPLKQPREWGKNQGIPPSAP